MTHINKVLHVSTVDLYEAEAYLVMPTPTALNTEIEHMIENDSTINSGYFPNY